MKNEDGNTGEETAQVEQIAAEKKIAMLKDMIVIESMCSVAFLGLCIICAISGTIEHVKFLSVFALLLLIASAGATGKAVGDFLIIFTKK